MVARKFGQIVIKTGKILVIRVARKFDQPRPGGNLINPSSSEDIAPASISSLSGLKTASDQLDSTRKFLAQSKTTLYLHRRRFAVVATK